MIRKRILIIGAGIAGKRLLRDILDHKELNIMPFGFIDDDRTKLHKKILGISVLGNIKQLEQYIKSLQIDKVLIALPSVDGTIISNIFKKCIKANVACQIVPRVGEIIEGRVDIKQVRDVKIEDFLGRPLRMQDFSDLPTLVRNKIILVTGAAGSIGSELCRQVASYNPKKLIMYDWWENGLYELGVEFREFFPKIQFAAIIGSIQDKRHIDVTLARHNPTIIFHAAAYKHVPLMEDHVIEAVKNNIFGTLNLIESAKEKKVKKVVFISTDKAVNPKSIMGASKLIGELITSAMQNTTETQFICVRFGNVLNSAGSVLPLFRKQISTGEITVTHEKMTRFFMTIQEAVQLILKATILGKGNEIFILDMGKPVKIVDLAKKFILLSGMIPEKDVKIRFIGTRPGEKLKEKLTTNSENMTKTKFEKIFVLKKQMINNTHLSAMLGKLQTAVENYDEKSAKNILAKFVRDLKL